MSEHLLKFHVVLTTVATLCEIINGGVVLVTAYPIPLSGSFHDAKCAPIVNIVSHYLTSIGASDTRSFF